MDIRAYVTLRGAPQVECLFKSTEGILDARIGNWLQAQLTEHANNATAWGREIVPGQPVEYPTYEEAREAAGTRQVVQLPPPSGRYTVEGAPVRVTDLATGVQMALAAVRSMRVKGDARPEGVLLDVREELARLLEEVSP